MISFFTQRFSVVRKKKNYTDIPVHRFLQFSVLFYIVSNSVPTSKPKETELPLKAAIHQSNKRNRSNTLNMTFSWGFAALGLFCPFLSTGINNSAVLKIVPNRRVSISVIMPNAFPTFIYCLLFTTMDYSSPARSVQLCKSSLMSVGVEWE